MTLKEKIEEREKTLVGFENSLALPECKAPGDESELNTYLNMDRKYIEGLTSIEAISISVRLIQYALFLQRSSNRETSRLNWLKTELKKTISKNIHNYTGSWEMQEQRAINDNDYAKDLQNSIVYTQQRVDRLYYLANCIQNLAKQVESLKYNRGGNHE